MKKPFKGTQLWIIAAILFAQSPADLFHKRISEGALSYTSDNPVSRSIAQVEPECGLSCEAPTVITESESEIITADATLAEPEVVAEEVIAEEVVAEEVVAEEVVAEEVVAEEVVAEEVIAEEDIAEEVVAEEDVAEEVKLTKYQIYLNEKLARLDETICDSMNYLTLVSQQLEDQITYHEGITQQLINMGTVSDALEYSMLSEKLFYDKVGELPNILNFMDTYTNSNHGINIYNFGAKNAWTDRDVLKVETDMLNGNSDYVTKDDLQSLFSEAMDKNRNPFDNNFGNGVGHDFSRMNSILDYERSYINDDSFKNHNPAASEIKTTSSEGLIETTLESDSIENSFEKDYEMIDSIPLLNFDDVADFSS
ncbi:MAG: hypothetical protein ACI9QD_001113 [Thermoproteota archaeon]|jgi:hypothetical protein